MKDQYKFIKHIEREYEKIAGKWLILHKRIAFFFVLAVFLIDLIIIFNSGQASTHHPWSIHLSKWFLIANSFNCLFLMIIYFICIFYSEYPSLKKYTVSLCVATIGFIFFSSHNIFPVLYFFCILPILLTAVYGDYLLTTITFIFTITCTLILEVILCLIANQQYPWNAPLLLMDFLMSLFVLTGFYAVCMVLIFFEHQKKAAALKKEMERLELQQALLRDGMTMLFNRSALQEGLNDLSFCEYTYIFVMIDLDNFKTLNDTFGHLKGDHCIKSFATILKKCVFPHPAFRFGGDEFCILFKEEPMDYVVAACEHIKNQLNSYTETNDCTFLSASFGIAQSSPNITIKNLLHNADTALYQAKNTKNCISIFS